MGLMTPLVADKAEASEREFLDSHPWIRFKLDLDRISPWFWEMLGQSRSKCRHIALSPLQPAIGQRLHSLYLAKGVHATTAIEGNTLSEDQVLQAVTGDLELPPSQQYLKQEVENILEACDFIERYIASSNDRFPITVELLEDLNLRVLDGLEVPDHVVPGEFRKAAVGVGLYRGAPPTDVPYLARLLCDWLNSEDFTLADNEVQKRERFVRAFLRAVIAHVYIAWIHPFGDGNGRTARLIEFGILTAAGIPSAATHLLSNHYNRTRAAYYRNLDHASRSGGDLHPFLMYAVEGFVDQLQAQLSEIRVQDLDATWENFVHHCFGEEHGLTAARQRTVVLSLPRNMTTWTPRNEIRRLTPEIAEAYAGKQNKTVTRDLNVLEKKDLIVRGADGSVKAKVERMYSLMPRIQTDLVL